jgi:hypothetical protein
MTDRAMPEMLGRLLRVAQLTPAVRAKEILKHGISEEEFQVAAAVLNLECHVWQGQANAIVDKAIGPQSDRDSKL